MGRTVHIVNSPSDVIITDVTYVANPSEPGFAQASFDTLADCARWLGSIGQNRIAGGYKIDKFILKITAAQLAEMDYEKEHDI